MKPAKDPDLSPNQRVHDGGESDEVENGIDLIGRNIWSCGTAPVDPLTAHVYASISIRLIAVSFSHSPSLLLAV